MTTVVFKNQYHVLALLRAARREQRRIIHAREKDNYVPKISRQTHVDVDLRRLETLKSAECCLMAALGKEIEGSVK